MIRQATFLFISLVACSLAFAFQSGDPFKPGKLPPAEVAALQQGLTLRFYAKANDKESLDVRRVRLAALHIPQGSPPTPFLAPGPFHARLTGYLKNALKGTHSFRLKGTGTITLKINDKLVLDAVDKDAEFELAKNYNRIEITYASPPQGDAALRLYWAGEKFGFEPVPPDVIFSGGDDVDLTRQTILREGRHLYASLHCSACHALPNNLKLSDCKMPELQGQAPLLDAGGRFGYDWLVAWILDPHRLRPEATMPRLLSGPGAPQQAADIAAYLTAQKWDPIDNVKKGAAEDGEALFKKLGCNSCHRLDDPHAKDELGRLSLHFVGAKFSQHALAHFLRAPHQRYVWTRMPDFRLSGLEAKQLESFLLANAKGTIDPQPKGDALRGQQLFRKVGCQNCHQIMPEKADDMKMAADLRALEKGCLAAKAGGQAPDFRLTQSQVAALTAFLKTDGSSVTRGTPAEFAQRQVKTLQCASCHRRDGASTRWHAVLEDDGKVPEALPSLTWAGEKLKPAWTKKLLMGLSDHSARPWIKARMPAFPARAEMLAVGLSQEHGFGVHEDPVPPHDPKLAEIGAKLIPQQGGFNCINCHGIGTQKAIAPFEAPGINLVDGALRLRHEYYQRWMLAPDRVDVTMRMPVFAEDGKTTKLREVFDGDARRQFEAIWHYIQTLPAKNK